ncbi:MAG: class I SAM-dependent methyltransferase [Candidatus Jordarchaeales archaeon]
MLRQILPLFNYKLKGLRVLEVGAGSGVDSGYLARLGARVCAVDYATSNIIASKWSEVDVQQADGELLPFRDESFDVVFSQGLIEHFKNPDNLLREKIRVTRRGGFIVIDAPQKYSLYHIYKSFLVALGCWPMGWERSCSVFDMKRIAKRYNLELVKTTGWGSWPISATGIKKLRWLRIPEGLLKLFEKNWAKVEESRVSSYVGMNITAVFRKPLTSRRKK